MRARGEDTIIVDAEIGAGHDGSAELIVRLLYENGVIGPVVLDAKTGMNLMQNCGVASVSELKGQSWRRILEGIS